MRPVAVLCLSISIATGLACSQTRMPARTAVPIYGYRVVHTYPHDRNAFTQGLEFREGVLYEGTGVYGRSALRKVELETGKVIQQIPLASKYFGEGVTVLNRQIIELTWTAETGFVYDQGSFHLIRNFNYRGEGWGLANDGQQIYMSDGSED